MAARFSDEEVLKATGASRRSGNAPADYSAVCTDTRALEKGCIFVALRGERYDAHAFLGQAREGGAAAAVVQDDSTLPPLPRDFPLYVVENTLGALGGLARLHRERFRIPVGAVGGSNGKTTTKEMVGSILATRGPALKTEGNLNNEVGVPLTLFRLEPQHVAAVVEVGMNRPGEITRLTRVVKPAAGLITVVQPEHLEGLGSIEGVAEAEGELFRELGPDAVVVVNLDDALIPAQAARSKARKLTFGRSEKADVRLAKVASLGREGLIIMVHHAGKDWPVRLHFIGEHNALNATGAFALAVALGYSPEECVKGLELARPYSRRLNVVDGLNGVTVIDDCYNANPASMNAALDTLRTLVTGNGRAVAVLGDMLELGPGELEEHAQLGKVVVGKAQVVAFFGPRSQKAFQAAPGLGEAAAHFTEVEPLLGWLKPRLKAGDVVLVKGSRGMRLERVVAALTGARGTRRRSLVLFLLYEWLKDTGAGRILNFLRYPTFRIIAAGVFALVMGMLIGPKLIARLRLKQHGQSNVREDTPDTHQKKKGTPTMGGQLILLCIGVSTLLFADLKSRVVWVMLLLTFGYGFIGFLDDWLKLSKRNSKGLAGRKKMVLQTVFYLVAIFGLMCTWTKADGTFGPTLLISTKLTLPFIPSHWFSPDLGWLYVVFGWFVIVGTSNAVNLTDGLDGLAIVPTIIAATTFAVLCYVAGTTLHIADSVTTNGVSRVVATPLYQYLGIIQVPGGAELAVFCASIVGAGISFLWFNTYPASVFMGDVGSLALGGALGGLAVMSKNEVVSAIIHGIFFAEALSVMIQVISFKTTGKRVFKMAPVHHHFELKGMAEPKIIVRFWIVAILCGAVALLSLKLR